MELTLHLPRQYEEIEEEEMMYLDGGSTTYNVWYGKRIYMSQKEAKREAYYLGQVAIGAASIGGIAGFLSFGVAALIGVLGASYAQLMANSINYHTTKKGVIFNGTWAGVFWSEGR